MPMMIRSKNVFGLLLVIGIMPSAVAVIRPLKTATI